MSAVSAGFDDAAVRARVGRGGQTLPVLVDCALYRKGERAHDDQVDLAEAGRRSRGDDDLIGWIVLQDPTHHDLAEVAEAFGLHELLVEDIGNAHQRSKVERYDDLAFVVLKAARYVEPDQVVVDEVQVITGPSFVVTVHHGEVGDILAASRQRLRDEPDLLAHGPGAVLYAMADAVVDAYVPLVQELELDVDQAQTDVFSGDRSNPAERIFRLKRQVLELVRNLGPMADVLDALTEPGYLEVDFGDELRPYFRDVADHHHRVLGRLNLVSELLSDALSANLAQVGVRQNDDMRTISAWAALIAAPTMLAGVWGMNFRHMPELDWYLGYPLALVSMAATVLLLYRRFKRVGWI